VFISGRQKLDVSSAVRFHPIENFIIRFVLKPWPFGYLVIPFEAVFGIRYFY